MTAMPVDSIEIPPPLSPAVLPRIWVRAISGVDGDEGIFWVEDQIKLSRIPAFAGTFIAIPLGFHNNVSLWNRIPLLISYDG